MQHLLVTKCLNTFTLRLCPLHEWLPAALIAGDGSTRPLPISLMQELQVAGAGRSRPCCPQTLSKPRAQFPSAAAYASLGCAACAGCCISQLLKNSS